MNDWVKLHRKIIDSRVFSDPFLLQLWVWCLVRANWKRSWFQGCEIEPGQFATGRLSAAEQIGVSGSRWYRGMQRLAEFGNIKIENVNNRFTLISVLNWSDYQNQADSVNNQRTTKNPEKNRTSNALEYHKNSQPEQPVNNQRTTDEQPANNQRTTSEQPANTIEEGKNNKKGKKERTTSMLEQKFEEFWNVVHRKVGKQAAKRGFVKAAKAVAKDRDCSTADACDWIASRMIAFAASDDAKHEVRGRLNPSTWLNEGRYDDDDAAWSESSEQPKSQFLSTEEMNAGIPPELLAKWEAEGV